MFIADTLSRAQLPTTEQGFSQEIETIHMMDYVVNVSTDGMEKIRQATKVDTDMIALTRAITHGWPDKKESLPIPVQDYFNFRDELVVQNGIVFKGERIVIPYNIRHDILKRIHSSHTGIQGCMRRARESVYWPGLNADITSLISACSLCEEYQPAQQKEPMISHQVPDGPWQKVGVDLFECESLDWMVTVDYFSGFFELDRLAVNKKADEVITKMKHHFGRHGIPLEVMSDNGPPFNSAKFEDFSLKYEFQHVTSSPRYSQSNGKAESAVKIASNLIKKALKSGTDI